MLGTNILSQNIAKHDAKLKESTYTKEGPEAKVFDVNLPRKKTPVAEKKVKKFPFKPVYTTKAFPAKAQYYSTTRAMQGRKWWLGQKKKTALLPTEVR